MSFLLLSPFLQNGGGGGVGGGQSRDALVLLPEGFPLLPLDLVQREGWGSLWSRVRCTRARFCLLGSFMDWGSRSCSLAADSCYLFCRLVLPLHLCMLGEVMGQESHRGFSLFLVASPASSLYARRGGEVSKCRSS